MNVFINNPKTLSQISANVCRHWSLTLGPKSSLTFFLTSAAKPSNSDLICWNTSRAQAHTDWLHINLPEDYEVNSHMGKTEGKTDEIQRLQGALPEKQHLRNYEVKRNNAWTAVQRKYTVPTVQFSHAIFSSWCFYCNDNVLLYF